jgi:hypothetical protein
MPSCPAPEFTVDDPIGDPIGFSSTPRPPDISSLGGGSNSANFCMTVDLTETFDAPGSGTNHEAGISAFFDADRNPNTGYRQYPCATAGIGIETEVRLDGYAGQLAEIRTNFGEIEDTYAIGLHGGDSITLIVPLDAIGGDDAFIFTAGVGPYTYSERDCVPNRGGILSPEPAELGDGNCDGRVDSLDALLAIQLFLQLILGLSCQYLADVNENGNVGPLDALQILQYAAGLIDEFIPET